MTVTPTTSSGGMREKSGGSACAWGGMGGGGQWQGDGVNEGNSGDARSSAQRMEGKLRTREAHVISKLRPTRTIRIERRHRKPAIRPQRPPPPQRRPSPGGLPTWNTNLYCPGATGPTNTVSSTWSYFSDSADPT